MTKAWSGVVIVVVSAACSGSPSTPSTLRPVPALHAALPLYDLPRRSTVTFPNLGTAIITNRSGQAQAFTHVVWIITDPSDRVGLSQIPAAPPVTAIIPAGASRELDVIFTPQCGRLYQHDVYESDQVRNGRLYTDGTGQPIPSPAGDCGTRDTIPPDVTVPGIPPGCRFDPGAPNHYRCDRRPE